VARAEAQGGRDVTLQVPEARLVLASQSVARRALLAAAGLQVEAYPAQVDEAAVKEAARAEGVSVAECAMMLAELKALRVSCKALDAMVIGADQILLCEGQWFDKPVDAAAAVKQLQALRGRTHELVTAVVCARAGQVVWRHTARPVLRMRRFSDAFLGAYLEAEGDAVLGSVGAYRLEALGVQLFDSIEGEHAAILGLPLLALLGFMRQHGALVG